ncbi:MAG: hypothetical protein AAFN74_16615 [Myxococcota bacterium]
MHAKTIRRTLSALVLGGALFIAGAAFAQQPGGRKPPPGYEKFEPAPESEQVSATNLVVLAYGTIFFGLFAYLVIVARSQSAMSQEMAELAGRLEKIERS